jgi:hypothetical protein
MYTDSEKKNYKTVYEYESENNIENKKQEKRIFTGNILV